MLLKLQIVFILTVKHKQGLNARRCERIFFLKFDEFVKIAEISGYHYNLQLLELLSQLKYSKTKHKTFRRTFLDQIKHIYRKLKRNV